MKRKIMFLLSVFCFITFFVMNLSIKTDGSGNFLVLDLVEKNAMADVEQDDEGWYCVESSFSCLIYGHSFPDGTKYYWSN